MKLRLTILSILTITYTSSLALAALNCHQLFENSKNRSIRINDKELNSSLIVSPLDINKLMQTSSPDGRFKLILDNYVYKLYDKLEALPIEFKFKDLVNYNFSENSRYFTYQDYETNEIIRYDLLKKTFSSPIKIPKGSTLLRVVNESLLIVRLQNEFFSPIDGHVTKPGDYALIKINKNFLGLENITITKLANSSPSNYPQSVGIVILNPENTKVAVLTSHYAERNRASKISGKYDYSIYNIADGEIITSSENPKGDNLDWSSYAYGIDTVRWVGNTLSIGSFNGSTQYSRINISTGNVKLFNLSEAYKIGLPTVSFDNLSINVTTSINDKIKSVTIHLDDYHDSLWTLKEQLQFSFIQNNEVVIISKNNKLITAYDFLNEKELSFEELSSISGKQTNLMYLIGEKPY